MSSLASDLFWHAGLFAHYFILPQADGLKRHPHPLGLALSSSFWFIPSGHLNRPRMHPDLWFTSETSKHIIHSRSCAGHYYTPHCFWFGRYYLGTYLPGSGISWTVASPHQTFSCFARRILVKKRMPLPKFTPAFNQGMYERSILQLVA